ncbi:MAG: transglycosylase SLT domain-containing protein [Candidatus Sulfotelmatobacter sp.]|jgi:membrane-bound lytic murein transglycosylase D
MRIAVLATLAIVGSSCKTAQKPVTMVPPAAPALTAKASVPASPQPNPAAALTDSHRQQSAQAPQVRGESVAPIVTPDQIDELLSRVERQYQTGLANYHAGHTDAARQNFDEAFNALLESKLDIRSDNRLEKEFDRIVDGVNHLDLGDTAFESEAQQSEPAPIDETNGITPAAEPGVRAKAQAEIKSTHSDLPLMMTDQVAGYISYFSGRGRGTFERAFARSGRYHDMMVRILRQEGVPQDLIYLAQAESGFQPTAVSRAGARGIWQFMGSRARGYGLQRSLWVDDRQDPEKSTRAAARHLRDLYGQFGDWYLAMAAYNSGPGTVQAAVKRTGYADFWELYRRNVLPKETRNYVPIILAVTIMTKNLSHYGFDDVSMDEPVAFDSVTVNYPVDLRLVADCVDATPAQLQQLNPSLLRLSTPKEGTFELHLPAGTKSPYQTAIAAIPAEMRLWWRYPTVHAGDTLASLARVYRTTARSIAEANQLDGTELPSDTKVIIPVAPSKHAVSDTATYAHRITRYKVRKGDTVQTVAENFGVSPQMIRRWNGLRGDSLHGRTILALHLPVTPTGEASVIASTPKPRNHSRRDAQTGSANSSAAKSAKTSDQTATEQANVLHHKVKSGETFYSIATTYKTTVAALKRNNQNVATLRPGMILVVQQSR